MRTVKYILTASLLLFSAQASAQTKAPDFTAADLMQRKYDTSGWNRVYVQYNPLKMKTDVSDVEDRSFKGFTVGYSRGIHVAKELPLFVETGIGATVAFNTTDSEDNEELGAYEYDLKQKTTLAYLSVPVNMAYKFTTGNGRLHITPYAGLTLKVNIVGKSKLELDTDEEVSSREEKYFWERLEDYGVRQEANLFDKKEAGGKDAQWKRFQMGWQVGLGLTYNSLYVGVGYTSDFMELYKKTKTGTATITLGYSF